MTPNQIQKILIPKGAWVFDECQGIHHKTEFTVIFDDSKQNYFDDECVN